jgi:hypothetical protein
MNIKITSTVLSIMLSSISLSTSLTGAAEPAKKSSAKRDKSEQFQLFKLMAAYKKTALQDPLTDRVLSYDEPRAWVDSSSAECKDKDLTNLDHRSTNEMTFKRTWTNKKAKIEIIVERLREKKFYEESSKVVLIQKDSEITTIAGKQQDAPAGFLAVFNALDANAAGHKLTVDNNSLPDHTLIMDLALDAESFLCVHTKSRETNIELRKRAKPLSTDVSNESKDEMEKTPDLLAAQMAAMHLQTPIDKSKSK